MLEPDHLKLRPQLLHYSIVPTSIVIERLLDLPFPLSCEEYFVPTKILGQQSKNQRSSLMYPYPCRESSEPNVGWKEWMGGGELAAN